MASEFYKVASSAEIASSNALDGDKNCLQPLESFENSCEMIKKSIREIFSSFKEPCRSTFPIDGAMIQTFPGQRIKLT